MTPPPIHHPFGTHNHDGKLVVKRIPVEIYKEQAYNVCRVPLYDGPSSGMEYLVIDWNHMKLRQLSNTMGQQHADLQSVFAVLQRILYQGSHTAEDCIDMIQMLMPKVLLCSEKPAEGL